MQVLKWPEAEAVGALSVDVDAMEWRSGACDGNTMVASCSITDLAQSAASDGGLGVGRGGRLRQEAAVVWDLGKACACAVLPLPEPSSDPPSSEAPGSVEDSRPVAKAESMGIGLGQPHAAASGQPAADFFGSGGSGGHSPGGLGASGGAVGLGGLHGGQASLGTKSGASGPGENGSSGRSVRCHMSEHVQGGIALVSRGDAVHAVTLGTALQSRPHTAYRRHSRVAWAPGSRCASTSGAGQRSQAAAVVVQKVRTVGSVDFSAVNEVMQALAGGHSALAALLQQACDRDARGTYSPAAIQAVTKALAPNLPAAEGNAASQVLRVAAALIVCQSSPEAFPEAIFQAIGVGSDEVAKDVAAVSQASGVFAASAGEDEHLQEGPVELEAGVSTSGQAAPELAAAAQPPNDSLRSNSASLGIPDPSFNATAGMGGPGIG